MATTTPASLLTFQQLLVETERCPDISNNTATEFYESPEAPSHTLPNWGSHVKLIAITFSPSDDIRVEEIGQFITADLRELSDDALVIHHASTHITDIPLSLFLVRDYDNLNYFERINRLYLSLKAPIMLDTIPTLPHSDIHVSLRSGRPFGVHARYTYLDTPAYNTLQTQFQAGTYRQFYQTISTYVASPSTAHTVELTPAFTGYTKGFMIEASRMLDLEIIYIDYHHLASGRTFTFTCDSLTKLVSMTHQQSYLHKWIPIGDQTNPFDEKESSFAGALNQSAFRITFRLTFDNPQQFVRIHSFCYNILTVEDGVVSTRYEITPRIGWTPEDEQEQPQPEPVMA